MKCEQCKWFEPYGWDEQEKKLIELNRRMNSKNWWVRLFCQPSSWEYDITKSLLKFYQNSGLCRYNPKSEEKLKIGWCSKGEYNGKNA